MTQIVIKAVKMAEKEASKRVLDHSEDFTVYG
jgi:hypothetical protein